MYFGFIKHPVRLLILLFFALYFFLGVFIFRDYGMSWDEPTSRDNGKVAFQYVTRENNDLLTYGDRDYGTAFELPLFVVEKAFGVTQTIQIYQLRHFFTFLLFFVSIIFFYKIASNRFSPGIVFLGMIFLALSPRIFADSFYNSKDIALLSGMTIAMYTLIAFSRKPRFLSAVLHAAACAFVVDIRLPGLIILPITFGIFVLDMYFLSARRTRRSRMMFLFLFFLLFCGFVVLFWPYLWSNPVGNFISAFSSFSHFLRLSDTVYYLGNYIPDKYVPWHYPLVWIGISTPLLYLILFLVGVISTVRAFFHRVLSFYKNHRMDVIFLTWFFGPLLMVIGLNSTLYDGWRQLYFIYPALLFVALIGLESLILYTKNNNRLRIVFLVFGLVNILSVFRFMTVNHPYQNLYFNELIGNVEKAKLTFDVDYWGLTFREGLTYIAAHDGSLTISVFFAHGHKNNIDILPDDVKKRFVVSNKPQEAKYILMNYRWYKDRNNYRWDPYIYTDQHPIFYNVYVEGVAVMTVLAPEKNIYPAQ